MIVRAVAEAHDAQRLLEGRLGHEIHGARSVAASGVRTGRTFRHFHLVEIENVAAVSALVAHAVDEDAVGCVEAAHEEAVARGVGSTAALACQQRDARCVAQDVGKRDCRLFAEHRLRNHDDRLRHVHQLGGVLRRGDLVAILLPFDSDFFERPAASTRLPRGRLSLCSCGEHGRRAVASGLLRMNHCGARGAEDEADRSGKWASRLSRSREIGVQRHRSSPFFLGRARTVMRIILICNRIKCDCAPAVQCCNVHIYGKLERLLIAEREGPPQRAALLHLD